MLRHFSLSRVPFAVVDIKARSHSSSPPAQSEWPLSIVVTTYRITRLRYVESLITSLAGQDYTHFELIFVVEKEHALLRAIEHFANAQGLHAVKLIFNSDEPGISGSRNKGIKASEGRVVAIVDDDVILPPHWCSAIIKLFDDSSIAAATGPVMPLWEDESVSWLPPQLHWLVGCSSWSQNKSMTETRNVWGANMAFRRTAILSVSGFSAGIGGILGKRLHGEENELSLRINRRNLGRIIFAPQISLQHQIPRSRLEIPLVLRSSYDMGRTRRLYSNHLDQLSIERSVAFSIIKDGLVLPLFRLPTKRKKVFDIMFISAVALFATGMGYVFGR